MNTLNTSIISPMIYKTFTLTINQYADLMKSVENVNKKIRKADINLPEIIIEVILKSHSDVKIRVSSMGLFEIRNHVLIAGLERESSYTIIKRFNDDYNINIESDHAIVCDHCKVKRKRNVAFILRNSANGELITIGSSCVNDFLKSVDALTIISAITNFIPKIGNNPFGETYNNKPEGVSLLFPFLRACMYDINKRGFISKKQDAEDYTAQTGLLLENHFYKKWDHESEQYIDTFYKESDITQNDQFINDAIAYCQNMQSDSDFLKNVKSIANSVLISDYPHINYKHAGTAACILKLFIDYNKKVESLNNECQNEYFGIQGQKKATQVLTLKKCTSFMSFGYGGYNNGDPVPKYVHIFENNEGMQFVWVTDKEAYPEKNQNISCVFNIKEHKEYKGRKQTVINYVKGVTMY